MKSLRILSLAVLSVLTLLTSPVIQGEESPPNVLLICVDDLRPELNCFGVDYIQSPHIDALASQGRVFRRHYVQAPTCGASRFALLTGQFGGSDNGALFARASKIQKDPNSFSPTMPAWFRQNGYTTVSVGKVSHHPGGRGGSDWDDSSKPEMPLSWDRHLLPTGDWQHPRGWMHGLAHGEIRKNAKDMDVFQASAGGDTIYPDGISTDEALRQMKALAAEEKPFFLAVGILRPHLPFGAPAKYLEPYADISLPPVAHPEKPSHKTTWHGSGEFMKYNRWGRNPNTDAEFSEEVRKHYAACVTYADAQVGRLMEQLKKSGKAENTIVVLWGDHGWHLGEHSIWGKHCLFEEALRSPLIISHPGIASPGKGTETIVETIDIFPTLCELAGLNVPKEVDGSSLSPLLENPSMAEGEAISYWKAAKTIRTDSHRLILHKNGHAELYDHTSLEKETVNLSEEHPDLVKSLSEKIQKQLNP